MEEWGGEGKGEHMQTHAQTYLCLIKDQSQGSTGVSRVEFSSPKALQSFATAQFLEPSLKFHHFVASFPVASADPQSLAHPPHLSPLLL